MRPFFASWPTARVETSNKPSRRCTDTSEIHFRHGTSRSASLTGHRVLDHVGTNSDEQLETAVAPTSLDTNLRGLSLSSKQGSSRSAKSKSTGGKKSVADSWEDDYEGNELPSTPNSPLEAEDCSSDLQSKKLSENTTSRPQSSDYPSAPPPTPVSPRTSQHVDFSSFESRGLGPSTAGGRESGERPEKTTAAASRMIAAGLGVRAPRRTEEERRYDKVLAENERRKRDSERERARKVEAEREKARRDMWEH